MLEKLLIENFQRHKRLLLEFDKEITCLWGSTDRGKSSCIRALCWLLTNQPRGDTFIRHDCNSTSVTLWVDGHKVKRERGKGVNSYQLDDGTPFEAFGSTVPEEIAKVLNVSQVSLQRQLDQPFFFTLSPGEVSRELNQIVNLDLIDQTLSQLAQEQRRAKAALDVNQDRLQQARDRKQQLAWVKQADQALLKLEERENQIDEWHAELDGLTGLLQEINEVDSKLAQYSQETSQQERLVQLGELVIEKKKEVANLDELLSMLTYNQEQIDTAQKLVEEYEQELKEKTEGKCPVCGQEAEVI